MNALNVSDRVAVCSWSLQPSSPADLVSKLQSTGIRRVQLALDPLRDFHTQWGQTLDLFRRDGITIVSGMFGCVGEDYSTLDTIRLTGGLAPDATWEENWKNAQATSALAHQLGLKLVTFHAGFLPHDPQDPDYIKLLRRLSEVADIFQAAGIDLGFETGQETASALVEVLHQLDRPNVGVNFDPANMILYDKGDPIAALRTLGPWIRQVHIKDATRTKVPGTWGEEVAAGTGEVDWADFFKVLRELGYSGDFVIEREAGSQRVADIVTAKSVVEQTAALPR
jgi:sugar phosphate isomerase/epimerase